MKDNTIGDFRLPPLQSQRNEKDPVLYLRFYLPGFNWAWYPCEAQVEEDDVLFYGFVTGLQHEFACFRLFRLAGTGLPLMLDTKFKPMKFSEAKKIYGFEFDE